MEKNTTLWSRQLNIVKMSFPSKLIYRLSKIPIKTPVDFFFLELDKLVLKFIWQCQGPRVGTLGEEE